VRRQKYSNLASKLQPYLNNTPAVAVSAAPPSGPHVHTFADLSGTLLESQAPWVLEAIAGIKPHGLIDPTWHTVTGAQGSVIGLSALNTLGVLPTTSDGATNVNTILRSGVAGELGVASLAVGSGKVLADATRLQTDNYTSQLTGWRHTYTGEFDTRYIFANEMKIIKFMADMQQALAGSQIVSKSVTTLAESFIAPPPGLSSFLTVDDLPSAEGMAVFESGDFILVTQDSRAGGGFSSTRCWGTVSGYTDLPDKKQRWLFTRLGNYVSPAPTETLGGTKTASSTSATLTIAGPDTGVAESYAKTGDLMLAFVLISSTTITTATPAGWTLMQTATVTGMRAMVYSKVRTASEPASYAWTHSASGASMGIIRTYQDVNATAPITASIIHPQETAAAFSVIKSLTPTRDTDRYVGFVAVRANRNPIIKPEGWSDIYTDTASSNTLAAFDVLTGGYAGIPFGDVSAALTGGTSRTISVTVNITGLTPNLDLASGFMPIGTVVAADAFVLDYGKSGNGWHEITAIDGIYGGNSPYSRVVSWTGHPATGAVVRTQDGNLKGIFGAGNEFGFFAGDGVTVSNQYLRISNLGAKLNNIPLELYSGGVQKVNIDSAGINVWIGASDADKRLTWDGATLGIRGAVTIDQASAVSGGGYLLAGGGAVRLDSTGAIIYTQSSNSRPAYSAARGLSLRTDAGALIGQLTGYAYSGVSGVDLYARVDSGQVQAVMGADRSDMIFGGGSAGAPRVEAILDDVNNILRMYSAGAIRLYQSNSATPDFQLSGAAAAFNVNVSAPSASFAGTLSVSSTTGLTGTKSSVAHNAATALCRLTIGGGSALAASYLVSLTMQSATTTSSISYTVAHAFSQATVTEHAKAMFGQSSIALTAAADTTNRCITLTLTQLNGSAQSVAVGVSAIPLCVHDNAQITLTML